MFRYLKPGEKGDYWGSASVLRYLDNLLRGRQLPEDTTVQHIEFFLQELYAQSTVGVYDIITFYPSSIRFVGPEGADGTYDACRITISYDHDRKITSIELA